MVKIPMKTEAKYASSGLKQANILGVNVSGRTREEVLSLIKHKMGIKTYTKPFIVVTVNPEFIVEAGRDNDFKRILNGADLAIADGAGLKWAEPGLVVYPGRELVVNLLQENKYRIFFLGGRGGVARMMAEKFGGGWDEGEENIKFSILNLKSNSNLRILNKINKFRPDLLLVAYGAPWQEKWIWTNRGRLKAKVIIGVGGAFDYLTGRARIPPEWINKAGLEWLWRLWHEPRRWRRQLRLLEFVRRVVFK